MNSSARLIAVVCGLAVVFGLCGCSRPSGRGWGVGVGSVTLTENGTTLTYALEQLTCDDRVYVVLAANRFIGGSYSGGEGKFRGQLLGKDGGKIDWSCTTPDGQSGKVIIDGQEFDLTRGALFLVSTKDKPTRIERVVIDAGLLQACSDAKKFSVLTKADPRIADFVQSCKDDE
jgi:hypothetical protein